MKEFLTDEHHIFEHTNIDSSSKGNIKNYHFYCYCCNLI